MRWEQARGLRPSAEALSRALRMAPDERAYLFDLAQQRPRNADKPATTTPPRRRRWPDWSPTCRRGRPR